MASTVVVGARGEQFGHNTRTGLADSKAHRFYLRIVPSIVDADRRLEGVVSFPRLHLLL